MHGEEKSTAQNDGNTNTPSGDHNSAIKICLTWLFVGGSTTTFALLSSSHKLGMLSHSVDTAGCALLGAGFALFAVALFSVVTGAFNEKTDRYASVATEDPDLNATNDDGELGDNDDSEGKTGTELTQV